MVQNDYLMNLLNMAIALDRRWIGSERRIRLTVIYVLSEYIVLDYFNDLS
jgi:hypothetical protein